MRLPRPAPRMCRRPGCPGPATASLSFRYADAEVHLFDLVDEPHPTRWDLCREHADALQVPRGWECVDERRSAVDPLPSRKGAPEHPHDRPAVGSDAGTSDTDPAPGRTRPHVDGRAAPERRNRYAELSARLPELAEDRERATVEAPGRDERGRFVARQDARSPGAPHDGNEAAGRPSAPGDGPPPRATGGMGLHPEPGPVENVPGQLAMPVGDVMVAEEITLGGGRLEPGVPNGRAVRHGDNVVPLIRRGLLDSLN